MAVTWANVAVNVAAAIEPLSVRGFIASQQMQSDISACIVIRYRAGLKADMRIVHGTRIYQPFGWLPDQDSGLEYLTAPCSLIEDSISFDVTADTTTITADNDQYTADAA